MSGALAGADIRLIASDLDGTLLGDRGALLEANTRALQRAAGKGIRVCIASGRLPEMCSRFALDMGLSDCLIVGLNGTRVLEAPNGRELFCKRFPPEIALRCWTLLESLRCVVTLYTLRGVSTNRVFATPEDLRRYHALFADSPDLVDAEPGAVLRGVASGPLKFLARCPEGEAQERAVREGLEAIEGVSLTASYPGTVEVMQEGVSKATGLKLLTARLGIRPEQVMAFGDYQNDIDMLAWAGHGVAMGNALPEVKAAARHVTKENTACGVAWMVEQLL